jgi:hypothetical protein
VVPTTDSMRDREGGRARGSGRPITFRAIKETVRAQYWHSPAVAQRAGDALGGVERRVAGLPGRQGGVSREAQAEFKGIRVNV